MRYYNSFLQKRMAGTFVDDVLQRNFPDSNLWGAHVLFDMDGNVEHVEVCKLHDVSRDIATWEHYANIQRYDVMDSWGWEVNTQFNGQRKYEMWIWAKYTTIAHAARAVATGSFKRHKKPMEKYI